MNIKCNTNLEFKTFSQKVIQLSEQNLMNKDGLYVENVSAEGKKSNTVIVDDLGDFIPFIGYFEREDLVKRHLDFLWKNKQQIAFRRAFAYSDLIFGLIWYGKIGRYKDLSLRLADYFYNQVVDIFFNEIITSYHTPLKIPLFNSIDATFIEVFTEYHRLTGQNESLKLASKIADFLINSSAFKKKGLLPELIMSGYVSKFDRNFFHYNKFLRARIMKNNTSFGFALLDLYRITGSGIYKEAFFKLVDSLNSNATKGGIYPHAFAGCSTAFLTPSFAVIDMLCDGFSEYQDVSLLEYAMAISDYWIDIQEKHNTGLFPNTEYGVDSYLDSETDMATSLLKLYELTGNKKYYNSSLKTLMAIKEFHLTENGLVLSVSIDNGEVLDFTQKTKFSLLALKPYIFFSEGGGIYQNEKLFMLLKDR